MGREVKGLGRPGGGPEVNLTNGRVPLIVEALMMLVIVLNPYRLRHPALSPKEDA